MAEHNSEVEKDLEKEITCIICHEHYTDPKVLPCFHYYCKQCISKLAQKAGSAKPFLCPECHKDTTLPKGGVDKFPTAFFINRMKAVYSKLEQAPVKQVSDKCELCSEDQRSWEEPGAFCQQCEKYLCSDCVTLHKKTKELFRGHKVQPIESNEPSSQACKTHKETLKYYCHVCNSITCSVTETITITMSSSQRQF